MLLIFSKRWTSSWSVVLAWEITRNVALSNNTTSSASHTWQNLSNCFSNIETFGINEYTIDDQAKYNVSSQIEVLKHVTFIGNAILLNSASLALNN